MGSHRDLSGQHCVGDHFGFGKSMQILKRQRSKVAFIKMQIIHLSSHKSL